MLNVFPDLLSYSLLAPLILRLAAGIIFIDLGLLAFNSERTTWANSLKTLGLGGSKFVVRVLGTLEFVGGGLLLLGIYTQAAALVLAILTLAEAYIELKDPAILKRTLAFYIMLFAITLSLLLSGAGAWSIDLPL